MIGKSKSTTRPVGILPDFLKPFDKFLPCQRLGVLQSSGQFRFGIFGERVMGSFSIHY